MGILNVNPAWVEGSDRSSTTSSASTSMDLALLAGASNQIVQAYPSHRS